MDYDKKIKELEEQKQQALMQFQYVVGQIDGQIALLKQMKEEQNAATGK